jgi:predicted nucleotidyltransferase
MAETKIYIKDAVDARLREEAMKRFGYGRGSISNAVEEAIVQWLMKEDKIRLSIDKIVEKARGDREAVAVIIFGSYARREQSYRDVDIAVLIKDANKASEELSQYIDVIGFDGGGLFDVSIVNSLPTDIQSRIFNEGTIVYLKDKDFLYDYTASLIMKVADQVAIM